MGRSKRKRIARGQQPDFAKKKKKLGKNTRPDNYTDTSLRTRQIFVPNQTRPTIVADFEKNPRLALTGLTLNELLNRTSHHNVNTRISAFNALQNALTSRTAVSHAALKVRLASATGAAGAALSDDAAEVRTSSAALLKSALIHATDPIPLLAVTRAHLLAALSHLRKDVRLHAARVIPELLSLQGVTSSALFPPPWTPLPALSDLLPNCGTLKQKADVLNSLCSCLDEKAVEKKTTTELGKVDDVEMLEGRRSDRPFYYNATPPQWVEQKSSLFHCTASTDRVLLLRRVCNVMMDSLLSDDGTSDAEDALFPITVKTLRIVLTAHNVEVTAGAMTDVEITVDDFSDIQDDKDENKNKNNISNTTNKRSDDSMRQGEKRGNIRGNPTGNDIAKDGRTDTSMVPRCVIKVLEECMQHIDTKKVQGVSAMLADTALEARQPELCMQLLRRFVDENSKIKSVEGRAVILRFLRNALTDDGEMAAHGRRLALMVTSRFTESIERRDARDARLWFDCVKQAAHLCACGKAPSSIRRALTGPVFVPVSIELVASGATPKPSTPSSNPSDIVGRGIVGISTMREAVNEAIDLGADVYEAFSKGSQSLSLKFSLLATCLLRHAAAHPAHGAVDETRAKRLAKIATMAGLFNSDAVAAAIANGFTTDSSVGDVSSQHPAPSHLAIALLDALEWMVSMPRTSCERPFAARAVALTRSLSDFISVRDEKDWTTIRTQLNRIAMAA